MIAEIHPVIGLDFCADILEHRTVVQTDQLGAHGVAYMNCLVPIAVDCSDLIILRSQLEEPIILRSETFGYAFNFMDFNS